MSAQTTDQQEAANRKALFASKYFGKTDYTPRPSVQDERALDAASLERLRNDQRLWDEAKNWRLDNRQAPLDRIAEIEKRNAEQSAALNEAAKEKFLAPAKAQFLGDGGTEADWPAVESKLLAQWREDRAYAALKGENPELDGLLGNPMYGRL